MENGKWEMKNDLYGAKNCTLHFLMKNVQY